MKFNLSELSGGLGDLGTFIPLAISMVSLCSLDGGSLLFFAGLFNIFTGVLFNQPIPVQPMKAIAAVAITEGLAPPEIAAAGFSTGLIILILGYSGLISLIEKKIPKSIVRGIQLGVGIKLALKGFSLIKETGWFDLDGIVTAFIIALFILLGRKSSKLPTALIVLMLGFIIFLVESPMSLNELSLGWSGPVFLLPGWESWKIGFLQGTLAQVPLTLLNSVIAISALSHDYFPKKGVSGKSMAISVGLMNIVGTPFGSMPVCHGSGGLAAQYRFGARTGGSIVMLGVAKILLAVLFGGAGILILKSYPISILGLLLFFSGIELSLPARDCITKKSFLIVVITAVGILAANTAIGFLFGIIAAIGLKELRLKNSLK